MNMYVSEQANLACVSSVVSESPVILKENLKQSRVYCILMHIELGHGFKSFALFCDSMERRLIDPLDALGCSEICYSHPTELRQTPKVYLLAQI